MSDAQKFQLLCSRFEQVGIGSRTYQSLDKINQAIDKLISGEFDREVSEQIFEQCNADNFGNILVEEYCNIIISAENILMKKYQASQSQQEDYEQKNQQCLQQLNMSRRQQINQYGISDDSVLNIDCIQAKNLRTNAQVYLIFKLGQDNQKIESINSPNPANPQWGQPLTLKVQTGQEQLIIEVYTNQNALIGTSTLSIKDLNHQQKIQSWLKLADQNYQETGEIELALQFIHNKAQYYEDLMRKIEMMKEQIQVDVDDYERDIKTIQEVHGSKKEVRSYIQPKPIDGKQLVSLVKQPVGYLGPSQMLDNKLNMKGSYLKESQISQPPPPTVEGCIEPSDEIKYFFLCGGLIIFFSLLQSLVKPSQTDFILGSLIILILWIDCFEQLFIRKVGAYTILTIIIDVTWWRIYGQGWWDSKLYIDEAASLQGLYRIAIICGVINLFIKVVMLYFLYQVDKILTAEPNNKYCFVVAEEIFIFGKNKRNPIFEAYIADAEKQSQIQDNDQGQINSQQMYQIRD